MLSASAPSNMMGKLYGALESTALPPRYTEEMDGLNLVIDGRLKVGGDYKILKINSGLLQWLCI